MQERTARPSLRRVGSPKTTLFVTVACANQGQLTLTIKTTLYSLSLFLSLSLPPCEIRTRNHALLWFAIYLGAISGVVFSRLGYPHDPPGLQSFLSSELGLPSTKSLAQEWGSAWMGGHQNHQSQGLRCLGQLGFPATLIYLLSRSGSSLLYDLDT